MEFLVENSLEDPEIVILRRGVPGPGQTDGVVTIPDYITEIKSGAFRDCAWITEVRIPWSVRFIGTEAFQNCRNLRRVIVSDRVTAGCTLRFGRDVFRNCDALADSDGFVFLQTDSHQAENILCEYYGAGGTVCIPDGTAALIGNVFSDRKDIAKVVIPDGTAMISQAFRGCVGLTDVCIPDSVRIIGEDAFTGCFGLADEYGFVIIRNILFGYQGAAQHIAVPEGVVIISPAAFRLLEQLETVSLPASVSVICAQAFYSCCRLHSVPIPDSVQEIGAQVFYDCTAMADSNGFVIVRDRLLHYYGAAEKVVIPDSVTVIEEDAFELAEHVDEIILPPKLREICSGAFHFCGCLTHVAIPDSVTHIGSLAFGGCNALETVCFPKQLKEIGYGAFRYCSFLKQIELPAGIERIGDLAFQGCSSLQEVRIHGRDCQIIGTPFMDCDQLANAYLHASSLAYCQDPTLWNAALAALAPEDLTGIIDTCPYIDIQEAFWDIQK